MCKRYGLEIGAYCSWLVRGLRVLTAPVAWPLAKLLDLLLGEESVLFRRQELNALISLHAEPQQDGSGAPGCRGDWGWGRAVYRAGLMHRGGRWAPPVEYILLSARGCERRLHAAALCCAALRSGGADHR